MYEAFQPCYQQGAIEWRPSSDLTWIGAFLGFLLVVIGVISGSFYDREYYRTLVVSGTIFVIFSMMTTSWIDEYYKVFFVKGLMVGLGAGLLFVFSVVIVATCFNFKRALVTMSTAAGGIVGMRKLYIFSYTKCV